MTGNGYGVLTPGQTMNRYIATSIVQKFYATLPHQLDQAEEEWHKTQPTEETQCETIETGRFGEDGWSISTSDKPLQDDD